MITERMLTDLQVHLYLVSDWLLISFVNANISGNYYSVQHNSPAVDQSSKNGLEGEYWLIKATC